MLLSLVLLSGSFLMAQKKQTPQEASAAKMIEMTNGVIEMYNNYVGNLKKVGTGLERSMENRESLGKNPKSGSHGFNCSNFIIVSSYQDAYEAASKAAPTFPEKAQIQKSVAFVIANTPEFGKRCSALSDYFNQRQHESDPQFVKYQVLHDSLQSMYTQVSAAWNVALALSSEVGDRCEILFLKNSPISEFIIPMKEDLSSVKKIISKFRQDDVDLVSIKADIEILKTTIEKSRSLTGKRVANLEKYSSKGMFTSFYLSMDDFIKNATKLRDYLDPEVIFEDIQPSHRNDRIKNFYSIIGDDQRSLIEAYNEM